MPEISVATKWDDVPVMLSTKQVAEVLGYGAFRIREMCAAGKIPHIRLGRAYRIPRDALRIWLEREALAVTQSDVG